MVVTPMSVVYKDPHINDIFGVVPSAIYSETTVFSDSDGPFSSFFLLAKRQKQMHLEELQIVPLLSSLSCQPLSHRVSSDPRIRHDNEEAIKVKLP